MTTPTTDQNNSPKPLPDIVTAFQLARTQPEPPPDLITGLFHREGKLSFGGGSKTCKSWAFIDLALSIVTGGKWLGLETVQSRVLYLNFEIPDGFFWQRLKAVAAARGVDPGASGLDFWNLRGHRVDYKTLIPKLIERVQSKENDLVIIDPIYKLYGKTDENSAGEVAELLGGIEQITTTTGAGVAFSSHFSKGNQSGKEAIDRVSGSGVFGRDPDTILNLTPHQDPDCFVMDLVLRSYPPIKSFVVKWEFPLFKVVVDRDPKKLKQSGGAKPKFFVADIIQLLHPTRGIKTTDLKKLAKEELGLQAPKTFYDLWKLTKQQVGVSKNEADEWTYTPATKIL